MSAFAEPIAWFCVFILQMFLIALTGATWFFRQTKYDDRMTFIETGTWTAGSK
jgi:hypothetical protein